MKALILTLAFIPCCVNGQSWFPDGAVWHYGYSSGFGQQGYVRFNVVGDTVVGGQTSRKLIRVRETYDFIGQQYGSEVMNPVIAHEAAGVVWLYVPSIAQFDTLYDLNALPGDHWLLPPMPDPFLCTSESRMVVTDTGTTTIGPVPLHWMAVDIHYVNIQGSSVIQDTIIERIGTRAYILPHDLCNGSVDGQEGGPLRCYQDAEIDYAVNEATCDFIIGMGDVHEGSPHFRLFPNPAHDRIHVASKGPAVFRVYDLASRMLLERQFTDMTTIDVTGIPAGLYVYELRRNGALVKGKFIRE